MSGDERSGLKAPEAMDRIGRRNRLLLVLAAAQILFGSLARHPVAGQGQFIVTTIVHVLLGLVLVIWILRHGIGLLRAPSDLGLRRVGGALVALATAQLALGLWVLVVSPEPLAAPEPVDASFVWGHATHVVVATLVLGLLVGVRLRLRGVSRG